MGDEGLDIITFRLSWSHHLPAWWGQFRCTFNHYSGKDSDRQLRMTTGATWWLVPLSKCVITCYNPSYRWINPTYPTYNWGYNLLTGMSHQVPTSCESQFPIITKRQGSKFLIAHWCIVPPLVRRHLINEVRPARCSMKLFILSNQAMGISGS